MKKIFNSLLFLLILLSAVSTAQEDVYRDTFIGVYPKILRFDHTVQPVNPSIIDNPVNKTANEGDVVTFSISASNVTTYEWHRVSSTNVDTRVGGNTRIYSFVATLNDDNTKYYCIAMNNLGVRATSSMATLTVGSSDVGGNPVANDIGVTAPTGTSVDLEPQFTWANANSAYTGTYDIQVATANTFSATTINMVGIKGKNYWADYKALQPNTTYYVRVRVSNDSAWSPVTSFKTWANTSSYKPKDFMLTWPVHYTNGDSVGYYKAVANWNIWYVPDANTAVKKMRMYINGKFNKYSNTVAPVGSNFQQGDSLISTNMKPYTYKVAVVLLNDYGENWAYKDSVLIGSSTVMENSGIALSLDDVSGYQADYTVLNYNTTGTYSITCNATSTPDWRVYVRDKTVIQSASINNGILTIVPKPNSSGLTGIVLKELNTGRRRGLGIRVLKADGGVDKFPPYVSQGSVSQNDVPNWNYWMDIDEGEKNKIVNQRYVYLLGDAGSKAQWYNYIIPFCQNSMKIGATPFFIFYALNENTDSGTLLRENLHSTTYMAGYYTNLMNAVKWAKSVCGVNPVGYILEPDMMDYMRLLFRNEMPATVFPAEGVEGAYTSGVLTRGVDPEFPKTLRGFAQTMSYIVKKYNPNAITGWEISCWGMDNNGGGGLVHATEPEYPVAGAGTYDGGRAMIYQSAYNYGRYADTCGMTYMTDFMSSAKYGLDGAYQTPDDPYHCYWFWNAQLWDNYMWEFKGLQDGVGLPLMMWQIPCGHLNSTLAKSPTAYNASGTFPDLPNTNAKLEDTSPTYLFGDTLSISGANRIAYFNVAPVGEPDGVTVSNGVTIWKPHIQKAAESGVICMMWGAGVGQSTKNVPDPGFAPYDVPSDSYFWTVKVRNYFRNPVPRLK